MNDSNTLTVTFRFAIGDVVTHRAQTLLGLKGGALTPMFVVERFAIQCSGGTMVKYFVRGFSTPGGIARKLVELHEIELTPFPLEEYRTEMLDKQAKDAHLADILRWTPKANV